MGDEANTTQQYRVLYRSWHYYVPGKNPLGESVLQYKEAPPRRYRAVQLGLG